PVRGADAVAGVGEVLRVPAGLRAVLGDRVAGELAAVGAELGDPTEGGDGERRVGPGGAGRLHEAVGRPARRGRAVGDALEVPVVGVVGGVLLPVVGAGRVAAGAVVWHVEVAEGRGVGEGQAVDERADGVAV